MMDTMMLQTGNLSHTSPRRKHRFSLASCADSVDSRGHWRRPLSSRTIGQSNKTPRDWQSLTEQNVLLSNKACEGADDLKRQSLQAHQTTRQQNIEEYQSLDRRFGEKLSSSKKLHALLGQRIKSVHAHVQRMRHNTAFLQTAHHAKRAPLELCTWRRHQRTERPGREKVRDTVETMLEEERAALVDSQEKLRVQIAKTAKMVDALNAEDAELRADLKLKAEAIEIDGHCRETRHSTWAVPPPPRPETGVSVPPGVKDREESRVTDTHKRLRRAEQAEQASVVLERESEELAAMLEKKCLECRSRVEDALRLQILKHREFQEKLQKAVAKTTGRINEMAHTISLTAVERQSHEEPCGLVNAKHRWRSERPPRENIEDPVAATLHHHTNSLQKNYGLLTEQNSREQEKLYELRRAREALQVDMADKTAALMIDLDCQDSTTMADKTFLSFLHRKGNRSFMMR